MSEEVEWPLYKRDQLVIGDLESSVGVCTLWTETKPVTKRLSPENFLVAGQCYNRGLGVNFIIRNILANKKIHYLVLCGADQDHTGEAILSLIKNGLDENREIMGFKGSTIEPEIPDDAVQRLRKNLKIIDRRDLRTPKQFESLDSFLSSLERKAPWGEPEIYPRAPPKPPETLPSEETAFVIRGEKVGDVFLGVLRTIMNYGIVKPSEYGTPQKEIVSITSVITDEDVKNIDWRGYFENDMDHFKRYLLQLMEKNIIEGLSYTYGSRIRNWRGKIDQIDSMIKRLRETIYTRRAVATTWDVEEDHLSEHPPCLDILQALDQDKLHMTAYFRSNDMFDAWPENVLAIRNVQYEVAEGVGVPVGSLIVHSNSAHIYEDKWDKARKILDENPHSLGKHVDPRGNLLVEVVDNKIKVTHLTPGGSSINEWVFDSGKQARIYLATHEIISERYHHLDIGSELEKAHIALKLRIPYVQDRELDLVD